MASWLAQRVVQRLLTAAVIDPDDAELYTYGFFLVISKTLFFGITAIMGALLGILGESLLFFCSFLLIRSYAGGIHAKRELSCLLLTALSIFAALLLIRGLLRLRPTVAAAVPTAVAAVCVLLLSPLDSKEKPLDAQERRRYRRIACVIVCAYCAAIAAALPLHCGAVAYPIAASLVLESILLLAGRAQRAFAQ